MPGAASLQARGYYAHPRNLFWPCMQTHLGVDASADYAQRLDALGRRGVALWDVLAACRRPGSLDGSIDRGSEIPNDIPGLLRDQPELTAVLLNGKRAATIFRRHLAHRCLIERPHLRIHALPSTSPANQSTPRAERVAAWAVIAEEVVPALTPN